METVEIGYKKQQVYRGESHFTDWWADVVVDKNDTIDLTTDDRKSKTPFVHDNQYLRGDCHHSLDSSKGYRVSEITGEGPY